MFRSPDSALSLPFIDCICVARAANRKKVTAVGASGLLWRPTQTQGYQGGAYCFFSTLLKILETQNKANAVNATLKGLYVANIDINTK